MSQDKEYLEQTALPYLKSCEKGRKLAPEYGTQLVEFDVFPSEWHHISSARFGEGRPCGWGPKKDPTRWTGDAYRYDIFVPTDPGRHELVALRWWNGSGEGWLISENKSRRGESNLLFMIADMSIEERRWDACHLVWQTAVKGALAGGASERDRCFEAFAEGRLKKRRKGGKVRVEILPKIVQVKS